MISKRLALLSFFIFVLTLFGHSAEPLHIHFLSGSNEYKSEASLKTFGAMLEEKYLVRVTATWAQDKAKSVDNLESVPKADLLIVYARRLQLPEEQLAVFQAHWELGKPIIGIRTASHAFSDEVNKVFDQKVLGNHYVGHHGDEPVEVIPAPGAKDHPLLRDVGEITSTKLYKQGKIPDATDVLQFGDIGKDRQPVTLVNEYKGGRMFYTSLGVPKDFEDKDFVRLLLNAIFWTTETQEPAYRK